MTEGFEREPGAVRTEYLTQAHRAAQTAEIHGPDRYGAFPGTWYNLIVNEPIIVVPDTNVLRQDIDSACQRKARGVLISAANNGFFRLICAEHVVDEVERHLEAWALSKNASAEEYFDRWNREYLPLLHVVRGDGLPLDVLSRAERLRVERLPEPKEDLSSIVLALCLGAFYLTKDKRAWETVYGRPANGDELYHWLRALQEGGDAGELGRILHSSTFATMLGIAGVGEVVKRLWTVAPWGVIALGGAATFVAMRTRQDQYRVMWDGLVRGLSVLSDELVIPYYDLLRRFEARLPQVSVWKELENENGRDFILARACIYYLGRSKTPQMSAAELSKKLRSRLSIGRDAQRVREVLRSVPQCFCQPYRGGWQVGFALQPLAPNKKF